MLALATLAIVGTAGAAFAVGRVSPAPATFTMTEGSGVPQTVTFTLQEPIIAMSPNPHVTLSFTIDDPARISLSPPTLDWDASQWPEPRTLQVTALHDGIDDASDTVTVHVLTTSASEFYDGYTTAFTVTLVDPDAPPPTTTTTTTTAAPTSTTAATTPTTATPSSAAPGDAAGAGTQPQLAMTGATTARSTLVGAACVAGGALLLAGAARSRHRRPGGARRHP